MLLDASGLQPTSKAVRIKYSGGERTVIDGPFTESKEIIAGYTIIQVKTREEGLEWARRFPAPVPGGEGEIEVRQLFEALKTSSRTPRWNGSRKSGNRD